MGGFVEIFIDTTAVQLVVIDLMLMIIVAGYTLDEIKGVILVGI
jgi:hypothetical protein